MSGAGTRTTRNPSRSMNASRARSRSQRPPRCALPSTSMTSLASMQQKSAKYGPIGCWRRNRRSATCRFRRCFHSARSGGRASRRSWRARCVRSDRSGDDIARRIGRGGRRGSPLRHAFGGPPPPLRGGGDESRDRRGDRWGVPRLVSSPAPRGRCPRERTEGASPLLFLQRSLRNGRRTGSIARAIGSVTHGWTRGARGGWEEWEPPPSACADTSPGGPGEETRRASR